MLKKRLSELLNKKFDFKKHVIKERKNKTFFQLLPTFWY